MLFPSNVIDMPVITVVEFVHEEETMTLEFILAAVVLQLALVGWVVIGAWSMVYLEDLADAKSLELKTKPSKLILAWPVYLPILFLALVYKGRESDNT